MLTGHYRLIQDGRVVAEADNLITNLGKRSILRYLSGQIDDYAGGVVAGTGRAAASAGDLTLGFEVSRVPVEVKAVKDYSTFDIVYRGSLPAALGATISELGLVTSVTNSLDRGISNSVLSVMDTGVEGWSVVTGPSLSSDSTNSRLGEDAIKINLIPANSLSTIELDVSQDLSHYVDLDKFAIQMGTFDNNTASVTVEFINSDDTSFSYSYTPATHTAGSGNFQSQILSAQMSDFTNWANPWDNIVRIRVTVNAKSGGAATVLLDGIVVMDTNTVDEDSLLVSRAVLGSPVVKEVDSEMDVEYTLRFAL